MEKPASADFKIPYRSLASYIGRAVRVFVKNHPLISYPPVYEGLLSAVFEEPPAMLLEEANLLVLNYIPVRNFYRVVGKTKVGSVFIKIEDLQYFEILESGVTEPVVTPPSSQKNVETPKETTE